MNKLVIRAFAWSLAAVALVALAPPAGAQALPSPRQFVDNLDLACYLIPNQLPLNLPLRLDHLNPLFQSWRLPPENVVLQSPQDLCVPIYKNGVRPPSNVLPFIQWVDWKCYGISGPSLNRALTLTNLNPEIANLVGSTIAVTVLNPVQLCVPVLKSFSSSPPPPPPPAVLHLVQYLDVKCYNVTTTHPPIVQPITIQHLNPLFSTLPADQATLGDPVQLCVPVEKNLQPPASDVLPIVQFSDVLCYDLDARPLNTTLFLTHLNPVLTAMHLPVEKVPVTVSDTLCSPVAKNGMLPPGPP
jgi:hypothetical protein